MLNRSLNPDKGPNGHVILNHNLELDWFEVKVKVLFEYII